MVAPAVDVEPVPSPEGGRGTAGGDHPHPSNDDRGQARVQGQPRVLEDGLSPVTDHRLLPSKTEVMKTTRVEIPVNWQRKKSIPDTPKPLWMEESHKFSVLLEERSRADHRYHPQDASHILLLILPLHDLLKLWLYVTVSPPVPLERELGLLQPALLDQPVRRLLDTEESQADEQRLGGQQPAHGPPVHQVAKEVGLEHSQR